MELSEAIFFRPACLLEATGPDAAAFLQGQFSNDLRGARPGDATAGLWLNRKGKIVADSAVLCRGAESFLVVSAFCPYQTISQRLDDFLIMDEVELRPFGPDWEGVALIGQAAIEALQAAGWEAPAGGKCLIRDGGVAFWSKRGRIETLDLMLSPERMRGCSESLATLEADGRLRRCGPERFESLAAEALAPRVGIDVGAMDLPQDVGLVEGWVSFRKGCYLGQEVMARLNSMGRSRKRLARVAVEREAIAGRELPAEVFDSAGRRRGSVRVLAETTAGGRGLAVVSVDAAGTLRFADGVACSVIDSEPNCDSEGAKRG